MTPEDKQRAKEIHAQASAGEWRYENLNWVGTPLFRIYASSDPVDRSVTVFDNIEPDNYSYNNVDFVVTAQNLMPRALQHIEALENNLASARKGAPQSDLPSLTKTDIAKIKEVIAEAAQGPWYWETGTKSGEGEYILFGGDGKSLFPRMDTGENALGNLTFVTEARELMPKIMDRIEKLETEISHFNRPQMQPRPKPPSPAPSAPTPSM